jgi:Rhodopirellula transposase DDE domain
VVDAPALRRKFELLSRALNERTRRLWAATEALAIGRGGIAAVRRATGLSYEAVAHGVSDLAGGDDLDPARIRRPGGGRKRATELDPALSVALEALVEPVSRGDPESPLRWTSKSVRRLAAELARAGHRASHTLVAQLLRERGYSLQANRKTTEGAQHPDRDAQFQHINDRVGSQIAAGGPAISVDTKKKELIGNFKNAGKEWRPQGDPLHVKVHDFMTPEGGRVSPYGVYDIARNTGWVSVGITSDTAAFAVATIARWWRRMGRASYPRARSLVVTADGGGSNGPHVWLWKTELQKFADASGLTVNVCHLPPGTSKWNKIEHRLFSFITQNWRGQPLLTHAAIVSLISSTTTTTGLKVRCEVDRRRYRAGREVSDAELAAIRLERDPFHGDWNYRIRPRRRAGRKSDVVS